MVCSSPDYTVAKVSGKLFDKFTFALQIDQHLSVVLPFVRKKLQNSNAGGTRMNFVRSASPHFLASSGLL